MLSHHRRTSSHIAMAAGPPPAGSPGVQLRPASHHTPGQLPQHSPAESPGWGSATSPVLGRPQVSAAYHSPASATASATVSAGPTGPLDPLRPIYFSGFPARTPQPGSAAP